MSTITPPEREQQSFAETALRLGGKSEEEARRTGAVDKADEQVESLFKPQYQTVNSPIHRAVWDGKAPLELFSSPMLPPTAECDRAPVKGRPTMASRRIFSASRPANSTDRSFRQSASVSVRIVSASADMAASRMMRA